MSYVFVLREWHRYAGWAETCEVTEVTGSIEELTARLHQWAVELISGERLPDGEYWAQLVEVGETGDFHSGKLIKTLDVFWFYSEEYVPAAAPC